MTKAIVKWGLKMRRVSIIWWSVGVVWMVALELAFYPSLHKSAEQLTQSLAQLPASVKNLIGGDDYASAVGYLNGRVFYLVLPILLSILAIGLGSSLLSREEDDGTLEVLLARPISRTRLYFSKALVGLSVLAMVSLTGFFCVIGLGRIVNLELPIVYIAAATLSVFLFSLSLGSFAFMLSGIGRTAKGAATGLAAFFAFGGYILSSLTPSFSWLKIPARFFAFYYYRSEQLLRGHFAIWPLITMAGASMLFVFIGWLAFTRRDLRG